MKHNKVTCDRCKRDIKDVGYIYREINYRTVPPFMSSTGSEVEEISIDLCEECMRHFHNTVKDFLNQASI